MFKDLMKGLQLAIMIADENMRGRTEFRDFEIKRRFRRAVRQHCASIGLTIFEYKFSTHDREIRVWAASRNELDELAAYIHQLEFWASVPRPTLRERLLAFLQTLKSKLNGAVGRKCHQQWEDSHR